MYEIQSVGDTNIVKVDSDVDRASKDAFSEALASACESKTKRLIVSLERCQLFDTSGLNALLSVRKHYWIPIAVVVPPRSFVNGMFFATGMSRYFNVVQSLDEALAAN